MRSYDEVFAARKRWMVALDALPRPQVLALAETLMRTHTVQPRTVPQSGLALLPLRESVNRTVFYLGEIPLSSSHVEIKTLDGRVVEGAALIMADDADYADALAICEGVLAHHLDGWAEVAAQVAEGLELLRQRARIRKTMLDRSRVNFSLLNEEEV